MKCHICGESGVTREKPPGFFATYYYCRACKKLYSYRGNKIMQMFSDVELD